MTTLTTEVPILRIQANEVRARAYAADTNGDGILQKAEADAASAEANAPKTDKKGRTSKPGQVDLFSEAKASSRLGKNAGWGAGLALFFGQTLPTVAKTIAHQAVNGALLGVLFQAIGSGARNIEALKKGQVTGGEAIKNVVADSVIAGGSSAGGAVAGGLVIAGLGPGLLAVILSIVVGAGAAYLLDNAAHGLIDKKT